MWKMDPISGFDIPLVFTLPPRDSTLQYERRVHLWNNFPLHYNLEVNYVEVYTVPFSVHDEHEKKKLTIEVPHFWICKTGKRH